MRQGTRRRQASSRPCAAPRWGDAPRPGGRGAAWKAPAPNAGHAAAGGAPGGSPRGSGTPGAACSAPGLSAGIPPGQWARRRLLKGPDGWGPCGVRRRAGRRGARACRGVLRPVREDAPHAGQGVRGVRRRQGRGRRQGAGVPKPPDVHTLRRGQRAVRPEGHVHRRRRRHARRRGHARHQPRVELYRARAVRVLQGRLRGSTRARARRRAARRPVRRADGRRGALSRQEARRLLRRAPAAGRPPVVGVQGERKGGRRRARGRQPGNQEPVVPRIVRLWEPDRGHDPRPHIRELGVRPGGDAGRARVEEEEGRDILHAAARHAVHMPQDDSAPPVAIRIGARPTGPCRRVRRRSGRA